jgi:non-ribosomal peptide synthetase component F
LPTDRPRPPVQTFQGTTLPVEFPDALSEQLRVLSRKEGVTAFMLLLSAFSVLLSHYSGQEDVVVGTDVANRNRAETEGLIGFFVNQLVMRVRPRAGMTFRELLQRVRETALDAYAHQDVPFDRLVNALKLERDASRSPLYQVKLVLQNAPMTELELADLKLLPLEVESDTAKFDLVLGLEEKPRGLVGSVEYNTQLFDAQTIGRMMAAFEALLGQIVQQPEASLSELSRVLSEVDERERQKTEQSLEGSSLQRLKQVRRKGVSASNAKAEGR